MTYFETLFLHVCWMDQGKRIKLVPEQDLNKALLNVINIIMIILQ